MKVLVTGAKGFVGKNLCLTLKSLHLQANHPLAKETLEVLECDLDTPREQLEKWLGECDFVFHLAGVNRPKDPSEFKTGNTVFTEDILERLSSRERVSGCKFQVSGCGEKVSGCGVPVVLASSTQAALDNDYGRSKKAAEDAVFAYGEKTGAPVFVYRFANVFGKWCRPNNNSAVATWCYNIAHDLPIMVRDPNVIVTLIYIDDLVNSLVERLRSQVSGFGFQVSGLGFQVSGLGFQVSGCGDEVSGKREEVEGRRILSVEPSYTRTLGEITELIYSFHKEPETLMVPDQADGFAKKLYATYLSYLPEDKVSYPLTMHCDERGSFTEVLHSAERGQVSVNISKPGITKGQHWHHTKHEKFCVVSGRGLIQFRKMDASSAGPDLRPRPTIEYHVSGDKLEVVRIPPGYTHNIINEGDTDMVTVMWANEVFDPERPDTYREKV